MCAREKERASRCQAQNKKRSQHKLGLAYSEDRVNEVRINQSHGISVQQQKLCSSETSLSGADVNSSGTCVYSSGTGPDTESQGGSVEEKVHREFVCS